MYPGSRAPCGEGVSCDVTLLHETVAKTAGGELESFQSFQSDAGADEGADEGFESGERDDGI